MLQVARPTPELTARTLPSPRPVIMAAVEHPCGTKSLAFAAEPGDICGTAVAKVPTAWGPGVLEGMKLTGAAKLR